MVGFFKTPQQLDLSSLSAQATTQLERARRLAAQYAASALQSRPKLKLHLVLDAPKVGGGWYGQGGVGGRVWWSGRV